MSEPSLGPKMPGWQMSEESLRALASEISAGRSLVPQSWPEDNRVAVLLSFDVDTQTWELMNGGRPSSSDLSQGEYGARVGLQRVVDRLTEYRVPASFFVPAVSAMLHPGMVETLCAAGGHEIGVHGWVHEHPSSLEPSEELDLMERSVGLLTSQAGRRPVGYRAPAYDVPSAIARPPMTCTPTHSTFSEISTSSMTALSWPMTGRTRFSKGRAHGAHRASGRVDSRRCHAPRPARR